jgi:hypothetical protein
MPGLKNTLIWLNPLERSRVGRTDNHFAVASSAAVSCIFDYTTYSILGTFTVSAAPHPLGPSPNSNTREVLLFFPRYLVRLQNAGTACRYLRYRKEVLLFFLRYLVRLQNARPKAMRYALFTRTYVGVAYSMNQSTAPVCTQLALSDADGYLAFPVIISRRLG